MRNSVRDKLKNSVAFSGNAQTAAVRLRHAFKRHARRGVSAGGGALLLLGARGMVGSGAGAVAAPTDVGQVRGSSASSWTRASSRRRSARCRGTPCPWRRSCATWRGAWRASAGFPSYRAANNFAAPTAPACAAPSRGRGARLARFAGSRSMPTVAGAQPPSTRRAIRSASSSVVTASRTSSSVAAGASRVRRHPA